MMESRTPHILGKPSTLQNTQMYEDRIYEVYTAQVETNSFYTSKMVQQIKELAAKLKDLNLIPGTHVVGENQLL